MLTAEERETIIRLSDGDDSISIWTAQRTVINALRKRGFKEASYTEYEGSPQAEFVLPVEAWNVVSGIRHKNVISDEERKRRSEHMKKIRQKRRLTPA